MVAKVSKNTVGALPCGKVYFIPYQKCTWQNFIDKMIKKWKILLSSKWVHETLFLSKFTYQLTQSTIFVDGPCQLLTFKCAKIPILND